jgi:hypothetical protein
MGIRWTRFSLINAVADLRRHRLSAREFRKFVKTLRRKQLTTLVDAWFLHSRTQTIGAKFVRAGTKGVIRVTGAAANVTDAAVSAISFVNPVNWVPSASPFSTPEDGSESRRLARNLPYSSNKEFSTEVSRPSSIKPPIFE